MNKSLALFAAISTFGAIAAQAYDGTVTISGTSGTLGGGPFSVSITKGPGPGLNGAANSFLTFCLERNEFLDYGIPYNVNVTSGAINGGVSGGNPDPISAATAWVYANFVAGTLPLNPSGNVPYTGDEVQAVIWELEGENVAPANPIYPVNANLLAAAQLAAGSPDANLWGVRAMNLYSGAGTSLVNHQDLLVVVPEPSTYIAGGLALLPLLFGLRSRLAKK